MTTLRGHGSDCPDCAADRKEIQAPLRRALERCKNRALNLGDAIRMGTWKAEEPVAQMVHAIAIDASSALGAADRENS